MVREPVVDGLFYPDDANELKQLVNRRLAEAEVVRQDAIGIVGPCGPYDQAAAFLACAVKAAAGSHPEVIVLFAPPHADVGDRLLLPESTAFGTPLGEIPVATDRVAELRRGWSHFVLDEISHLRNHTLEPILPFLRSVFAAGSLIPILVGELDDPGIRRAVTTIADAVAGRRTLFVASANLSSFGAPGVSDQQSRHVVNRLYTEDDDSGGSFPDHVRPPRGYSAIRIVHHLCRPRARLTLLKRGTVETEEGGELASLVYGSFAYYEP